MLDIMLEELRGPNILIRPVRDSDAESIVKHIHDLSVARNTFIPYPYRIDDAYTFIRESRREWDQGTSYRFGIIELESGEMIGGIGLESVSRNHRNAEMGYWLSRHYRGRGLMNEAVGLGLRFAFRELKLVRVHAHVMKGNVASTRVLERAGFQPEGYLRKRIKHRGRWKDLYLFAILKEEWGV